MTRRQWRAKALATMADGDKKRDMPRVVEHYASRRLTILADTFMKLSPTQQKDMIVDLRIPRCVMCQQSHQNLVECTGGCEEPVCMACGALCRVCKLYPV